MANEFYKKSGMNNFQGYHLKIGNCKFLNPAIKREGLVIYPQIEQVTENQVLASGKLKARVLPHKPHNFDVTFPIMTVEQYREYEKVIGASMHLSVTYYDYKKDQYVGPLDCYHTDIKYTPVIYKGREMVQMDTIKFKEW